MTANCSKKIVCFIFIVLMMTVLTGCMDEVKNMPINDVDFSEIEDGEYIGEYKTTLVSAKVKVTIEDHKIIKIEILEHDNGRGKKAEKIIETVIEEQTLSVDVISGATASSKVILKAIEKSLLKNK